MTNWPAIRLTAEQRRTAEYRNLLGGGAEAWDTRGRFQLELLKRFGLKPSDTLLDVGCGPLRAGTHIIDYLDPGNYTGVDCNADFIEIAQGIADARLEVVRDFAFPADSYDYVWAFSVLNHCTPAERRAFFANLPSARVYVSHARWYAGPTIGHDDPRLRGLRASEWGWPSDEEPFPFIEINNQ